MTEPAPHLVAYDGTPHLTVHRKAHPGRLVAPRLQQQVRGEQGPAGATAGAHRTRELRALPHPSHCGEHLAITTGWPGPRRRQARSGQTLTRARPLRRRAARIARPARVRMRSRNPCVFARRRLFGWNVRLLTGTPGTQGGRIDAAVWRCAVWRTAGPVQDMRKLAYRWPVSEPYAGRLALVKPGGDPLRGHRRQGAGPPAGPPAGPGRTGQDPGPGPGAGHPAMARPAPCVTLSVCQTCVEPAP